MKRKRDEAKHRRDKKIARKKKDRKKEAREKREVVILQDSEAGTLRDKQKILGIEQRLFHKDDKRTSNAIWDHAFEKFTKKRKKKRKKKLSGNWSGSSSDSESASSGHDGGANQSFSLSSQNSESGFKVDMRGDYNNVLYESLYRLDIPSYRRCAHNTVLLGLEAHWKVVRDVLKTRGAGEPVITGKEDRRFKRTKRYFSRHRVLQERDASVRKYVLREDETQTDDSQAEFIPAIAPSSQVRSLSSCLSNDAAQSEVNLMRICHSAHTKYLQVSDEPTNSNLSGHSPEEVLLQKTREFNVQLRENPHDIPLWFRFVEFQDETFRKVKCKHCTFFMSEIASKAN